MTWVWLCTSAVCPPDGISADIMTACPIAFRYTSAVQSWCVKQGTPTPGAHGDAATPHVVTVIAWIRERLSPRLQSTSFPRVPYAYIDQQRALAVQVWKQEVSSLQHTCLVWGPVQTVFFSFLQRWTWTSSSSLDVFLQLLPWSVQWSCTKPKCQGSDTNLCPHLKVRQQWKEFQFCTNYVGIYKAVLIIFAIRYWFVYQMFWKFEWFFKAEICKTWSELHKTFKTGTKREISIKISMLTG